MRKAFSRAALLLAALTTLTPAAAQEATADDAQIAVVAADGGVRSISAGYGHTCAVSGRGNVWCWGDNRFGQLGIGTTENHDTPQRVVLGTRITAVTTGAMFTCALSRDGRVSCWGHNYHGQVGDSSYVNRTMPAAVNGLGAGVRALASGTSHSCAINAEGEVLCWGNNVEWQLGQTNISNSSVARRVPGISGRASAIGAGFGHSCAIARQGRLYCWGSDGYGQLGQGDWGGRYGVLRVRAMGDDNRAIALGGDATCAINVNRRLMCWGANDAGQIGIGTNTPHWTRPVAVASTRRFRSVALGASELAGRLGSACAVATSGVPYCWGYNASGQLGIGSQEHANLPQRVFGIGTEVQTIAVAQSGDHSCAIGGTGEAFCWGDNRFGQLGIGTLVDQPVPQRVLGRLHLR